MMAKYCFHTHPRSDSVPKLFHPGPWASVLDTGAGTGEKEVPRPGTRGRFDNTRLDKTFFFQNLQL